MPIGEFRISGYMEPEEVRQVIHAVTEVSKHPDRDYLLLETLWQTGARVTEALDLLPEKIGSTSMVLPNLKQMSRKKVTKADGSTGYIRAHDPTVVKEVEVSRPLCDALKEFCDENEIMKGMPVFFSNRDKNKPLSRWYVWDITNKASEKVHVFKFGKRHPTTGGRFKGAYPHLFRHSNAMFLLDQTENIDLVREHLGHASVMTTQGYARIKQTKMKRAIKEIKW